MSPSSRWPLFFVLSLFLGLSAAARVGETEAALAKALGEPKSREMENVMVKGKLLPSFPKLAYAHGDWAITCVLVDDLCAKTTYARDGVWPDEEYARVLAENAQGATWEADAKGSKLPTVKRAWVRSDGATAVWRKNVGLTIVTPAFIAAEAAVKDKARNNIQVLPKKD